MEADTDRMVADALKGSWVHRFLPQALWPYAQLARWERPIGWKLLLWPCMWSAALVAAAGHGGWNGLPDPFHLVLFLIGAILMRGAGCTYNDLIDQQIDDKVARTRSRPLPSGRVSRKAAKAFLVAQSLGGLVVLLQFNPATIGLGVLSLVTVAIYPFMKRITWWPQLFLGFAFSWGALMGWPAVTGSLALPAVLLYAGSIAWVIGYDTIYAHQDIEDDALVGVKSTARLFAERTHLALALLYGLALALFGAAFATAGLSWPAFAGLTAGALHMGWQLRRLDIADPALCLKLFKSNSVFGWILFLGLVASGLVSSGQ
jgi:4-hydroxybenzoate polyprenyltransferase